MRNHCVPRACITAGNIGPNIPNLRFSPQNECSKKEEELQSDSDCQQHRRMCAGLAFLSQRDGEGKGIECTKPCSSLRVRSNSMTGSRDGWKVVRQSRVVLAGT